MTLKHNLATIDAAAPGDTVLFAGSADLLIRNNRVSGSGKTAEGLGIEVWGGCDRAVTP